MMTSTKYPTLGELEQYHLGTLPASRCHEIESLALNDPSLAEAMEGYEAVPSFEPLPSPDHVFKTKIHSITATHPKAWWLLNGWIIAMISDAFIFGGVIASLIYIEVPVSASTPIANTREETTQKSIVIKANETPLQLNKEVQLNNVATNVERLEKDPMVEDSKDTEKTEMPSETASRTVTADEYKYIGVDLKYIGNHKVLDYSEIFKNDFPEIESFILSENKQSSGGLSYLDFLTKALALYDAKEFNSCRIIFNWMLSEHGEDVNAEFFGAMTAHQLGDYEAAKNGFQRVLNSTTPVHKEEARRMISSY